MAVEQNIETIDSLQNMCCRVEVIAKFFGVSVRRIQQLTQEGIISTESVVSGGRRLTAYNLVDTIKKYTSYLSDRANGRAATASEEELKKKKLEVEIALRESQAELHQYKTARMNGEYLSREEAQLDYIKLFVILKKCLMNIPSRVVGLIASYIDPAESRRIEKDIALDINNVLTSVVIAGTEAEPAEQKKVKRGRPRKAPKD